MKQTNKDFIFHATTTEAATVLLNSNIENGLTIENANERLFAKKQTYDAAFHEK